MKLTSADALKGIDISIPTTVSQGKSYRIAARKILEHWPNAVFETGAEDDYQITVFANIDFDKLTELFVYKDLHSHQLWNEHGAVPEAMNKMVYLVAGENEICIVFDVDTEEMNDIVDDVRLALS